MKLRHFFFLLTAPFISNLSADTIVLKTGVTYEGRVVSQDDKSYLVEIHVTKSIKDERRIPKDNVKEIIKEAKDAKDFERVKNLVPTPDRLNAKAYVNRIQTAKDFLAKYPQSKHAKTVKPIIQTLESEHQAIIKGGIKLGGLLISASSVEANAYDVHARILLLDIKKLAANGHYLPALRKWDTLKKDYSKSAAYKDSLALTQRILTSYSTKLTTLLDTLDARIAKRENTLESLPPGDRERATALLAEKKLAFAALIEKEQKQNRSNWLPVDPFHKAAIEHNLRSTDTTLNHIGNQSRSDVELAGPALREAWSALAKGDLEEATKLVQKLQSMQLPKKYTAPLAKQLDEKQVDKAAREKAAKEKAEQEWLEKIKAEKEAAEKAANETKGKKKGRKATPK